MKSRSGHRSISPGSSRIKKPSTRVYYDLREIGKPDLIAMVIEEKIK
ncbi:MAG: hypothetical protein MZV63_63390 [Marinilabiliales bacterium]|nr:hypothetical protein [Marinilabiliales bacterium]